MLLQNIITPAAKYSNREESIKKVKISNINYNANNNDLIINCISNNKYKTIVKFIDDIVDITIKNNILIHCDCKSFQFEFAFANKDNLLYPNLFLDRFPREKNIALIPGVCKHLYALGRHILSNKNKILIKLKGDNK